MTQTLRHAVRAVGAGLLGLGFMATSALADSTETGISSTDDIKEITPAAAKTEAPKVVPLQSAELLRLGRGDLLKGLDALLAEQQALRLVERQNGLSDLTLTFSGRSLPDIRSGGFRVPMLDESEETDESFFYLRDVSNQAVTDPVGLAARPDFSTLIAPNGEFVANSASDTITGARVGLALGTGVSEDGRIDPGFLIDLASAYRTSARGTDWSDYGGLTDQVVDRRYDLGVSVGYSGFNVDAHLSREWSPFRSEQIGYDVGFSYQSSSWSARLAWSAYKSGEDLRGFENDARDFISFELGANLKLTDTLGLTGGIRHYEYDQWRIVPGAAGEKSQMIFLGGRLAF